VLLEVEVLPDGRAGQVRVLLAPDYPRLVEAAVEATRKATFRPALLDGRPVRSVIEIPFRFRLE
jgi:TonB family protein